MNIAAETDDMLSQPTLGWLACLWKLAVITSHVWRARELRSALSLQGRARALCFQQKYRDVVRTYQFSTILFAIALENYMYEKKLT